MTSKNEKHLLVFSKLLSMCVCQVSSQSIAVLYPEKGMVGETSPASKSTITKSKYVNGNMVN